MIAQSRKYASYLSCVLLAGVLVARADRVAAQTPDQPADNTPGTSGAIQEPPNFAKAVEFAGKRFEPSGPPKNGIYPELGRMITGSGWISVGPGYRHTLFDGLALVDASTAISWRAYKIAQGRVEFRPLHEDLKHVDDLVFGSQVFWSDFTQVRYYGIGPDSSKADKSEYRLRDVDVVGYATVKKKWVAFDGSVGYLRQPTIDSPAGPFRAGWTDARVKFDDASIPGLNTPASYLHAGLNVSTDFRDEPGYATRGGFYRAGAATYSDRDTGQFSFQRYELEGVHYVPLVPHRLTLALHGWLVASDTADGKTVPVYMLPSLGGHNTLRGYSDFRFHDRDSLVGSVEARWALMDHVDAALFFDAGNVAARVGDLNFDKTSIGVGLRVHTKTSTFGRLDVGHSKEGWIIKFKMDDPFVFSRLYRRTATPPFVP